jgi:hypothetical protein
MDNSYRVYRGDERAAPTPSPEPTTAGSQGFSRDFAAVAAQNNGRFACFVYFVRSFSELQLGLQR